MVAPILKTKRTILRHWKEDDLLAFATMNADKRVMQFFPSILSANESNEFAQKIIKELLEKPYGLWALAIDGSDQFIGFVGLHYADFPSSFTPCIEIGWRLAYPFWNKGYAFEAASRVVQYGFEELKLKEIFSFTTKTNLRSIQLMQKLNMAYVKEFYHPKIDKENPLSLHVLYKLENNFLNKK